MNDLNPPKNQAVEPRHTAIKTAWPILNTLGLLFLLLWATPTAAQAQSGDNFVYSVNPSDTNTITIIEYTGSASAVTIPTNINDLLVTIIGNGDTSAFSSAQTMVTIPNSVTSIGADAFYGCTGLTSVSISDSVTNIGAEAFSECSRLTSLTIPGSVASIGEEAFYLCSGLTNITIPSSVTTIAEGTFYDCTALTSIAIPDSVTSIGLSAFYGCTGLASVSISDSVTNIGEEAFCDCSSLAAITVETNNSFYSSANGVLFDKSQTTLLEYPGRLEGSYTIPDSVTSIGSNAFYLCGGLSNVTIPDSVISIPLDAFYGCSGLANVTIPGGVTNIGYQAFAFCDGLTNVMIPSGVTGVAQYAFQGCPNLAGVTAPGNLFTFPYVFFDCSNLKNVTIANGALNIGVEAFQGFTTLTNITIPSSLTNIGTDPFSGCSNLAAITVETNNSFYSSANGVLFDKSQTALLGYPAGLGGNYAIPGSVTSIGAYAFVDCSRLANITIPSSVTNIGTEAFLSCTKLTNVFFQGNAPPAHTEAFFFPTTIYYLPDASGWSSTYNTRPALLWNPLIQAGNVNFGVQAGQFGFEITGTTNIPVVVEASADLANPVWTALTNVMLTNGSFYFSDPKWSNYPNRFYIVQMP